MIKQNHGESSKQSHALLQPDQNILLDMRLFGVFLFAAGFSVSDER